jgi:splicing factor 3A subunit 1
VCFPTPVSLTVEIIEKTASYVARNNKDFEERIRENEKTNPKFAFLNPMDPYFKYYEWRLTELQAGGTKQPTPFATRTATPQIPKETGPPEPPAYHFSGKLPPMSAQDLDILRLTALFVARHGNQFQRTIAERESRNYQFDFLRPNHSMYPYFQQMVTEYHLVLLPPKDMLEQIRRLADDREAILEDVKIRVDYQKHILEKERKDKAEEEREKRIPTVLTLLIIVEYAQIDWHDFTVVATIEFTNADDAIELPPPTSRTDLEYASLEQKRLMVNYDPETRRLEAMPEDNPYAPPTKAVSMVTVPTAPLVQEVDMEISDGEEEAVAAEEPPEEEEELPQPKALPATLAGGMKIRPAGYVPRHAARNVVTQICPNCGEPIPVNELDEHMRIELLDPKWKEQKAVAEKRQLATNLGGADVARNVKRLAERGREDDYLKRQKTYMDR